MFLTHVSCEGVTSAHLLVTKTIRDETVPDEVLRIVRNRG